jgi:hypothetical protein
MTGRRKPAFFMAERGAGYFPPVSTQLDISLGCSIYFFTMVRGKNGNSEALLVTPRESHFQEKNPSKILKGGGDYVKRDES